MNIKLPKSDQHPLVKITVKSAKSTTVHTLDDSHTVLTVRLPKGVCDDEVDVIAEFCDSRGRVDDRVRAIVLQTASMAPKPAPRPYVKPKVEPKADQFHAEPKTGTPSPPSPATE
jgi:hypothetical protein